VTAGSTPSSTTPGNGSNPGPSPTLHPASEGMHANPISILRLEGSGVHAHQPVLHSGAALDTAKAAVILIHGRGAQASDILSLAPDLAAPGFAFLAPQAAGNIWYPNRYDTPLAGNEPWLSSALESIEWLISTLQRIGIPPEKVILSGFSQGACLSAEFAARNSRRYGGVAVFAGGLIGPHDTPRTYPGSLDGTPVFFGCSDPDPYFSPEWIRYSAAVFERLDARIAVRMYPHLGHQVNQDMLNNLRNMMQGIQ
jgi:predicted esterase